MLLLLLVLLVDVELLDVVDVLLEVELVVVEPLRNEIM